MNEAFKKFSKEIAAEMLAKIQEDESIRNVIEQTKAAEDSGSFEVVISTADIDRQGESIDQNGWDLAHYKQNPVVLWGHDYYSLPIGIADTIEVKDGKLVAKGRFAPKEANPFAEQVRKLYDLKIVRATSVGFIAREMEGNLVTKAELLEFSFVPVPANPYALTMNDVRSLGIDTAMLATKGLELKVGKAKSGDACQLENGSEGELLPNEKGELSCVPKKGAVGDQVQQIENDPFTKKWKLVEPVLNIFDAFLYTYLDDETPVESFANLLEEAVTLLRAKVDENGGSVEAKALKAALEDTKRKRFIVTRKDVQRIGAELATMQSTIDDAIVTHAKRIIEIAEQEYDRDGQFSEGKMTEKEKAELLDRILKAIQPTKKENAAVGGDPEGGGDGEEHPEDGDALNQRSNSAGEAVIKELDNFLMARRLLRSVTTATSNALEEMNKKLREESLKGRNLK